MFWGVWFPLFFKIVHRQRAWLYSLEYNPDTHIISGVNVHHGLNQRLHLQDISGLDFDGNNLLILSDESGVLLRTQPVAEQDAVISVMHLKKGCHGLEQDIPQPEGVATDDEGNIYVVSEPDGFWKFTAVKNVLRPEMTSDEKRNVCGTVVVK